MHPPDNRGPTCTIDDPDTTNDPDTTEEYPILFVNIYDAFNEVLTSGTDAFNENQVEAVKSQGRKRYNRCTTRKDELAQRLEDVLISSCAVE